MNTVEAQLAQLLGADRVVAYNDRGQEPTHDICRYYLGEPCAWLRPHSSEEVSEIVRFARAHQLAVVPVGQRTAYWNPLRYHGALVVDLARLDFIDGAALPSGSVRCGAGTSVRALDDWLRERGLRLAAYPDAYGGTSVGALVATGMTCGVGMGMATVEELVLGLCVVLGTGECLRTGAANVLGGAPFLRTGLPDPSGLLFASEGTLGVITEVAVRVYRPQPRARLRFETDVSEASLRAVFELAEGLAFPGVYQTFRAVARWDIQADRPHQDVYLVLASPFSVEEVQARAAAVEARILEKFPGGKCTVTYDPTDSTLAWWGPPAGQWADLRQGQLVGVDVLVDYASVLSAVEFGDSLLNEARTGPWLSARRAIYFAPHYVNLGLHAMLEPEQVARGHRLVSSWAERLAQRSVVPYRWGRVWGPSLSEKLDPGYRGVMLDLKQRFDPDGILNPGASLWL